ncbi:GRAS family protein RAM1-like [Lycium ferocissimum]|uniref:GRAS family protein RAM1-like n=1 Tax=Lycium ferocissimum TaxID=112874 RepID=UPI00281677A3|nr:GRAS family protein RAM1-like [Lycium ferocissimum]
MGDIVDHEEEFLSLRLAIVKNSSYCERKIINKKIKKRKRRELAFINTWDLNESCEGKIFSLLELREAMLKIDVNKKGVVEDGKGLHLIHSLLISATSIDENSMDLAVENLHELYQNVSLVGDSVQRVAAYFADGLIARLLTRKSPFYDMIMKPPTQEEEFLAFTEFYKVSPFYQFAHFTANQAILEAFEKELEYNNGFLHVIDFDISYGFQWPSLIQSLSENATTCNRISLKITGYGKTIDELRETETRLVSFTKGFRNLSFEFHGVLSGSKLSNLTKRKNETLAVNSIFHLNSLSTYSKISETLKEVHDLCPSIVTIVEQEGCKSPQNFLPRFMESLHYFAAMFDSLDDCLPIDSIQRLSIEKNHLGKEIKNVLNYDHKGGNSNIYSSSRYEQMETWKGRMESHGFLGIPLSCKNIMQAKLLLKIRSHSNSPIQLDGGNGGFRVFEIGDPRAITLAWQDRSIVTASAWYCVL